MRPAGTNSLMFFGLLLDVPDLLRELLEGGFVVLILRLQLCRNPQAWWLVGYEI